MDKTFVINGREVKVQDFIQERESVTFTLNGAKHFYMLLAQKDQELVLDNGGRFRAYVSLISREGDSMVISNGKEATVSLSSKKFKKKVQHRGGLISPMPGKIFKILKKPGNEVKKGETILILEAMKMEHAIRSDHDGIVKKICFREGELVQGGVTLAEVDP